VGIDVIALGNDALAQTSEMSEVKFNSDSDR
jgi:hypothetical protein